MSEIYRIIYVGNNPQLLGILQVSPQQNPTIREYFVASRRDFTDPDKAVEHAENLGIKYGKTVVSRRLRFPILD